MTLKDELFNKDTVSKLSNKIKEVYPRFNEEGFIQDCVKSFPKLELKERMSCVREQLYNYLPKDYIEAVSILSEAMKVNQGNSFINGSVIEYLEAYGCNDEYVDLSLLKLAEFTKYLSSEFAIRPFLNKYPDKTLKRVLEWTRSEDVHIRRFASEGTRPSLPWAMNITMSYKDASIGLDHLYNDKERYVTRSIANHLNDISKIDPIFVLEKLTKWRNEGKQNKEEMNYIINHSLRTLIKKGHPETLEFLGYNLNPNIITDNLTFQSNEVKIGEKLEFSFDIESLDDTKLMIDYTVYYPSATKRRNQKTYKLKSFEVKKNKKYTISGTRSFKKISTRKLRPGTHEINIQINGKVYLQKEFLVIE